MKNIEAEGFIDEIKKGIFGPVIFYSLDYVFHEAVTSIVSFTRRKDLAVNAGEAILPSKITRVIRVDDEAFRGAWNLFKRFKDKLWSFTDCTSFVLMKRNKLVTSFTFDEHYRQAGFKTLPQSGDFVQFSKCRGEYVIKQYSSADFERAVDFSEDTHLVKFDRPLIFPDVIGGHCLIPNAELLLKNYDSKFLRLMLESNEKRKKKIKDESFLF